MPSLSIKNAICDGKVTIKNSIAIDEMKLLISDLKTLSHKNSEILSQNFSPNLAKILQKDDKLSQNSAKFPIKATISRTISLDPFNVA